MSILVFMSLRRKLTGVRTTRKPGAGPKSGKLWTARFLFRLLTARILVRANYLCRTRFASKPFDISLLEHIRTKIYQAGFQTEEILVKVFPIPTVIQVFMRLRLLVLKFGSPPIVLCLLKVLLRLDIGLRLKIQDRHASHTGSAVAISNRLQL